MEVASRVTSLKHVGVPQLQMEGEFATLPATQIETQSDGKGNTLSRMRWAAKEPVCKVIQSAMRLKLGRKFRNVSVEWLENRAKHALGNKGAKGQKPNGARGRSFTTHSDFSVSTGGSDREYPVNVGQFMSVAQSQSGGDLTLTTAAATEPDTCNGEKEDEQCEPQTSPQSAECTKTHHDIPAMDAETESHNIAHNSMSHNDAPHDNDDAETEAAAAAQSLVSNNCDQIEFQDTFHRQVLQVVVPDMNRSPMAWLFPLLATGQLEKKLRVERLLRQYPEIARANMPHDKMVFIIGLPRTGSTFLHNLYGELPDIRTVKNWEFRTMPDTPEDTRMVDARRFSNAFYSYAKRMRVIHEVRGDDSDECCNGFMDGTMPEWHCFGLLDLEDSYKLFRDTSMVPQYQNYEKFLRVALNKVTTSVSPTWKEARRVVLKSPHNTFKVRDISVTFPGCKFVWLHRNPIAVVASCLQMNIVTLEYLSKKYQSKKVVGLRTLKRLGECVRIAMAQREALEAQSGAQFVDVYYYEFVNDPVKTVMEIEQKLDDMSGDAEEQDTADRSTNSFFHEKVVETAQRLNASHRKKKCKTSGRTRMFTATPRPSSAQVQRKTLEAFGITEFQVLTEFSEYIMKYDVRGRWQL